MNKNDTSPSNTAELLKPYRDKIDALDDQIIDLLGRRLDIIHEVSVIKNDHNIAPILQNRVDEVRGRAIKAGIVKGYSEAVMREIYTALITYSCETEQAYIDAHKHSKKKDVQHD